MFHVIAEYLRGEGEREWSILQTARPNSVVLRVFRPGESQPFVVVKVSRPGQGTRMLRGEASALKVLQEISLTMSIPRFILEAECGGDRLLLAQSGVPGRPMSDHLEAHNRRELCSQFRLIDGLLETFQKRLGCDENLASYAQRLLSTCCGAVGLTAEEQCLLDAVRAIIPELTDFPAAAVHGDFWAGNVLENGNALSVLDWGHLHYGAPTEDLHNFTAATCYRKRRTPQESGRTMWEAFFGDGTVAKEASAATLRTLNRWKIDVAHSRTLFRLFLISRLSQPVFINHPGWRAFISDYVQAGMPAPFSAISKNQVLLAA
jgi:hypothetical protein